MKKIFLICLVLFISFHTQAQNQAKRFAVKSGKLVLNLSGNTTGTKTIYFDDYGLKYYEYEKSVSEVKMFGMTDREEKETILIMNKDKYWSIDKIKNENYRGTTPYYNLGQEMAKGMTEEEQKKMADDILNSLGGQKLGKEDVLGHSCDKISVLGAKSWIYKGIILRSEINVMGIITNETATSFEENISVPSSKFEAPSGTTFEDIDAQQHAYFGQMDISMEEEDYGEDVDIYPLSYSYDDFTSVVNAFNPEGYARTMVMNQDEQYMALYNQGFTNMIAIVATSSKNVEKEDEEMEFETFTYKGKTIKFGEMNSEGMTGKGILVPYDEHNMHIMLMSIPGKDKQSLLSWLDELDF